jgi:hypothetical protein
MRRSFMRDKHWVLLAILMIFSLAAPAARAQSQSEDQEQEQIQGQPPVQPENQLQPGDEAQDSHARIVRISFVDGQVRIDRGQGYESATMNTPVTEGNWIQTRSDGWAEVQLEDGSLIRMAPDTVIAITQLSRLVSGGAVSTIDLDQGEAEFKVAKHDDGEFQVTVKNKTIVLAHSSSFRVTSTNANPLEVVVWKGEVGVRDSESGGEVAVKKNETFALDPMDVARYALDQGAEADQLDEWGRQRDEALSAYASASRGSFQSPYQYGTGDLNYYGQYFDAPGYGTVWQPAGVGLGWDPFSNGYWVYSPGFGYTWVSAYPWGWLPYRYGNWVYVNHHGWCWVPGGWSRWHTGPRWTNAPPGFRPPAPPVNGKIVIGGAPGGRVIVPGKPWDRGGPSGRSSGPGGRVANRDGDDHGGARTNPRVFTNDDVQGRVPRTDVPATQPSASGAVTTDHTPKVVQQQPAPPRGAVRQSEPGGVWGDRPPRPSAIDRNVDRNPESFPRVENTRPAEVPRTSNPAPAPQHVSPPASPVRQQQYTPPPQPAPARQYTPPPAPAPVHQAPPASAPIRQSSPPPESHAPANEGTHGRPK